MNIEVAVLERLRKIAAPMRSRKSEHGSRSGAHGGGRASAPALATFAHERVAATS